MIGIVLFPLLAFALYFSAVYMGVLAAVLAVAHGGAPDPLRLPIFGTAASLFGGTCVLIFWIRKYARWHPGDE